MADGSFIKDHFALASCAPSINIIIIIIIINYYYICNFVTGT